MYLNAETGFQPTLVSRHPLLGLLLIPERVATPLLCFFRDLWDATILLIDIFSRYEIDKMFQVYVTMIFRSMMPHKKGSF